MGILVKTAASMQDVKELLEPINENIDSLKGSVSSINEEISNLEEKKINSIKVLEGEEYKATDGKIDISPSVEPIKSATESNDNAIKVLGDKVYNLDGTRLLIEHGTEVTIKEYIDKKMEEQLGLLQGQISQVEEQISRVEGEISYIVCTDVRTENSAVISLESNVDLTELKDGMVIRFSPKYNSQAGAKIKINDLEEVALENNLGYMSFILGNSYELIYVEAKKLFKSNNSELIGVAVQEVKDMNDFLYDSQFLIWVDESENIPIANYPIATRGLVKIKRLTDYDVIQEVQNWGLQEKSMYRRVAWLDTDNNQWIWGTWYNYTGSIDTLLRDKALVTKQSAVKMGKSKKRNKQ